MDKLPSLQSINPMFVPSVPVINRNKKKNKKKKLFNKNNNIYQKFIASTCLTKGHPTAPSGFVAGVPAPSTSKNVGNMFAPPVQISMFAKLINDFVMPRTIQPSLLEPAVVLNGSFVTFTRETCSNFTTKDHTLLHPSLWQMIMIVHQERAETTDIVEALYAAVGTELFAPFAYTSAKEIDYFIVCNQSDAIKKLFAKKLTITVKNIEILLVVKLGISRVTAGHPKLVSKIKSVISDQMNVRLIGGEGKHLDLSNFSELMLAKGVTFSLSNKACFNLLCDQLNSVEVLKTSCRDYRLAHNKIRTLEPFTKLFGFVMSNLDLRYNEINTSSEFHYIKHLDIKELVLDGNFCTKLSKYREKIQEIVPSVARIDIQTMPIVQEEPEIQVRFGKGFNKFNNGIGNMPIPLIEDGIVIRRNPRKHFEFTRVRDTFQSYRNDYSWAQITVHHENSFTKEEIIDEVVEKIVGSQAFFPCYYKSYGDRDEFYLCRNFDAINQLMIKDLELQIPPSMKKIVFTLRLDAAKFKNGQVDWSHKIHYVLSKRIKDNVMDIHDFANDPEFEKIVIPMSSKYTLNFIIEHAKKHSAHISKIIAHNNGIKGLEGFQSLHFLSKLVTLDLRDNRISSLAYISQTTSVSELMLDGNPICEKFRNPHEYVTEVCKFFPQLEWLDGHRVNSLLGLATLQNFLVVRDAYTIGEEFVKTFFPLYDSFERGWLMQMYDRKAIFSLSSLYNIDRVGGHSAAFQRIQAYTKFSRNLKFLANMKQACEKVVVGTETISRVFSELPKTNHDIKSFCVDVPVFDPTRMVIITVSGVFEKQAETLNGTTFLLGFARTFVLVPADGGAYNIANDQLFIHDPPFLASMQGINPTTDNNLENVYKDLKPTEIEEKTNKLLLFQNLTELKKEECIRHLEESFWEFKVALATFNTIMDSNDIADSKFDFK